MHVVCVLGANGVSLVAAPRPYDAGSPAGGRCGVRWRAHGHGWNRVRGGCDDGIETWEVLFKGGSRA